MLTFCDVSVMARCDVIFVLDLYPQLDVLTGDPSANGGGLGFFSSSEAVEAEGAAHLLLCREAVMRRLRRSSLFFFPSTSSPRLLFAASVFFL